jgi:hypothetical protein
MTEPSSTPRIGEVGLERPTGAPPLYSQDGKGYDAVVHAHYFIGSCDWLVTEYNPHDDLAFGWACLGDRDNAELGYVSLAEMMSIRIPLVIEDDRRGLRLYMGDQTVERDEHWPEGLTLNEAIALLDGRQGR